MENIEVQPLGVVYVSALSDLVLKLHRDLSTIVRTIGHRHVATLFFGGDGDYATACPGDKLYALLPDVRAFVHFEHAQTVKGPL